MARKHCEKRRNCSLRAISPFPTVFSKGLFPRGVKRCHCVGMGERPEKKKKPFENITGKGETAGNQHFLPLFDYFFLPHKRKFLSFFSRPLNGFSLFECEILSLVKDLSFYHTVPNFNDPKEEGFRKLCWKRRRRWLPAFSPSRIAFSTPSKREIIILATFNLLSACALNLISSKIFVVW